MVWTKFSPSVEQTGLSLHTERIATPEIKLKSPGTQINMTRNGLQVSDVLAADRIPLHSLLHIYLSVKTKLWVVYGTTFINRNELQLAGNLFTYANYHFLVLGPTLFIALFSLVLLFPENIYVRTNSLTSYVRASRKIALHCFVIPTTSIVHHYLLLFMLLAQQDSMVDWNMGSSRIRV